MNDNTTDSKKVSSVYSRRCMKLVVESSAGTVVKLNECAAAAAAAVPKLTHREQTGKITHSSSPLYPLSVII